MMLDDKIVYFYDYLAPPSTKEFSKSKFLQWLYSLTD